MAFAPLAKHHRFFEPNVLRFPKKGRLCFAKALVIKMKLFAPKYYRNFACIADKCTHSCCIGWEIDIDAETAKKYDSLKADYGKNIKNSMEMGETLHFALGKNERCPHLDERGLCKIITELGEDYLCEICREHPRFYNDISHGMELGIGMACEEAARIILSSDEYDIIEESGEIGGVPERLDFDTAKMRSEIYSVLKKYSVSYTERLHEIYEKFDVSPDIFEDKRWRDLLLELEYLDEEHKALFQNYSSAQKMPKELQKNAERVLAYFIYRHCTTARDKEEYRAVITFCLFLEKLFVSVLKAEKNASPVTIARIISEEIEYSEDNTERIINEIYFLFNHLEKG